MDTPATTSFLLRFWREPSGASGDDALRCYLRNLRTGSEEYLGGAEAICERVLREAAGAPSENGEAGE